MNKGTLDLDGVVGWDFTSSSVKRELRDMGDVDEIDVYANSPGGYIDDGFGIYTALKNHKAKVNFHVTGMAASMMSVIMTSGDSVTIEPTGMVMVHPPSSICWGSAEEMRSEAGVLDKYQARLIKAYKRRDLNISDSELDNAVNAETWYTADEALEAGFVDEVVDGDGSAESEPSNTAMEWLRVARYKNAPKSISNHIKTNRKKANSLKQKLISNDGSAVETTEGTIMTTEVQVSEADIEARVKAAVTANDNKWEALLSHEKSGNTVAVLKIAAMGLSAEQSATMMDIAEAPALAAAVDTVEAVETNATSTADLLVGLQAMLAGSEVNNVNLNASIDNETDETPKPFDAKSEFAALKGDM